VFGIDDEQGSIDNLAIGCHLPGQALQRISLRLDFDASDVTIYDSDVDAAAAMIDTKFVDHEGVGTGLGMC